MATDLATLMVKVDATEAGKAATDLDKMTAAGKRAEGATNAAGKEWVRASSAAGKLRMEESAAAMAADKMAASTKGAGAAAAEMAREAQRAAAQVKTVSSMSGAAAFATRNLGYQMSDVITQLASGAKPMQVFAQQGFQIADALSQIKREADASGKSMAGMIAGSFGRLGPVILVAAAAAATLGGALKILQDDINETGKANASFADTALGVWDGMVAFIQDKFGPAFEWLANVASQAWEYIASAAKAQFNFIVSTAIAVPKTIYAAFTTLPGAIAELFVNMANGAIEAIERMVNSAINGLKSAASLFNSVFGTSIGGGLGNVTFGRIENSFKGAGARAGAAMSKALFGSFRNHWDESVVPYFEPFIAARASKATESAGKKAGAKGGRAAGKAMAEETAKSFEEHWADFAKNLVDILEGIDKTATEIAKNGADELDGVLKEIGEVIPQIAIDSQRWADQLERTVSYLSQMGGFAGTLGRIGEAYQGITTGNFGGGRLGSFLGQLNETQFGKEFLTGFKSTLDDFFGGAGKFTEALGAFGLAVSANQLIGDIFGFKGGPLGVLTDLVGSIMPAKKGRATFSGGLDYAITGNSAKRKDAVSGIGGSVVDSLQSIADALGVGLTGFTGTVAIRKDSLRYDPTGQGITRLSKGAIDFGQDEAALIAAIIKDAIADGAFEGLSEGFKNYLTSGDVESRLQDVLNLRGVMNEAAQMRDPQGFALAELDKWRTSMLAIATATGEGMADIEYVYGKKREEILAAANDNIVDLTRERQALLAQIAELEGRYDDAKAIARQLELDGVDASLKPLYERIYALQDEQAATNAAAQAAAELAAAAQQAADEAARLQQAIEQEAYGLTTRLLQLQGDTNALRQRELDALNPVNRAILEEIFALEDQIATTQAAAAAAEALAREQAAAAAEAQRIADELAAQQRAIAQERYGLETQLLTLLGDTEKLRERELALLDPSNRELQKQIWALEDQAAAAKEAAGSLNETNDALDAIAKARDVLSQAYSRERQELEQTRDKFQDFAQTIREFRLGLFAANDNGRSRVLSANTPEAFTGAAQSFLDASRASARTRADYQGAVGFVARQAQELERQFGNQASAAQQQINLLEQQVKGWIDLSENVVTVEQAIRDLEALGAEKLPDLSTGLANVANRVDALGDRLEASEAMTRAALEAIAQYTAQSAAIWRRVENNGALAINTREGDEVATAA